MDGEKINIANSNMMRVHLGTTAMEARCVGMPRCTAGYGDMASDEMQY